jgi:hypothetical protein
VAFRFNRESGSPLLLRRENRETLEAAPSQAVFEGLSASGRYLFYLLSGNVYRFDATTGENIELTESADATVANVAASGEAFSFVSPTALSSGPNPVGASPQQGSQNLYLWRSGVVHFVGDVTANDVLGSQTENGEIPVEGLGLWAEAARRSQPAKASAQSNASGSILLFKSRAPLTGYDSRRDPSAAEGEAELFRFDAPREELTCISCDPTGLPPSGSASLLSLENVTTFPNKPMSVYSEVPNLADAGNRVLFQSPDPLAPEDGNGVQDVYEWEAPGVGSCTQDGGCLSLISTGKSAQPSYLFGASESGDDVFIRTGDQLTRSDDDATASIYDARVEGGFAEELIPACQGEGCRPAISGAPHLDAPASNSGVETTPTKAKSKQHKKKHKKHKKHKKKHSTKSKRGGHKKPKRNGGSHAKGGHR